MAWGGMRYPYHRDLLFSTEQFEWLTIAEQLRNGRLCRFDAYAHLAALKKRGRLRGVGPAFYTKVIYFLTDDSHPKPGYIMDQWMSCSVNLIAGSDIVLMNKKRELVSDRNSAQNYEIFCNSMDTLRDKLRLSRGELDCALFCKGGRYKGPWRKYVIANRCD